MIAKFYKYLEDLLASYKKLASLLTEKIDVVEHFDLSRFEEIMKEEQIVVLVTKGFDQNMQRYKDGIGYKGDKLSDIIDELPAENQADFRALYRELRAVLEECRTLNEQCQNMIKDKLYVIDKRLKAMENTGTGPYGAGGTAAATKKTGILSKSV